MRPQIAAFGMKAFLAAGILGLVVLPAGAHGGGGHGGGGHGGGGHGGYSGGYHGGYHGGYYGGGYHGGYYGGYYGGYHGGFYGYHGYYGYRPYGWGYPGWGYGGFWALGYRPYPYYGFGLGVGVGLGVGIGLGFPYGYPGYVPYGVAPGAYLAPSTVVATPAASGSVAVPADPAAGPAPDGTQPQIKPDGTARLMLLVPANAQVWFDGAPTTQAGTEREFVSPMLAPGRIYTYSVRVRYLRDDGRVADETRPIRVRANDRWVVDFTRPAPRMDEAADGPPQNLNAPKDAPLPVPRQDRP